MKVLFVNPIIYTSEGRNIKKVNSIKDTMSYDLCLAFVEKGIEITLASTEEYRPLIDESYPFHIVWLKSRMTKIFSPHCIPFNPGLLTLVKSEDFDFIISSEVFSLNSLMLAYTVGKKLIIWQELAKHNNLGNRIPSKLWHNIIARNAFRRVLVVPRSVESKKFISGYCKNVCDNIVDHGVNLEKFQIETEKDHSFVICSQLIPRKRIDDIIENFNDFIQIYDDSYILYIIGEGEEQQNLENLSRKLNLKSKVVFTGKLEHEYLKKYLKKAKAMLVNTEKDNNMISIVESIAVGTPVITTSIPYNTSYINKNGLGIVCDNWGAEQLWNVVDNNILYCNNCIEYRNKISTKDKVNTFIRIYELRIQSKTEEKCMK